jgi:hypothetical protein
VEIVVGDVVEGLLGLNWLHMYVLGFPTKLGNKIRNSIWK